MIGKKSLFFFVIIGLLGVLSFSNVVRAEEIHLTPNQLDQVRASCPTAEATLNQLHSNDALLRVNVGQSYESISTRLIKRFNSRVSYNNLGNTELVYISNDYDKSLDNFRNLYRDYETSLSSLAAMDCEKNPAEFYNSLEITRNKRLSVRSSVVEINNQLKNYADQVEAFEANYRVVAGKNEE